jgi:alkanesulfonate monooxygenase SsuD/methylene tetrahydromethanopterin reductase-like flavin-dependent oxidoreductase (luciferase family)
VSVFTKPTVGVITHFDAPTAADVRALAIIAEDAGADWLGVPDAFWWRDTWVLLAEAARVTTELSIGPAVTNPFLRHPFHTIAAVASLQELAGPRVFLGLGAGGSEVSGAAGIPRHRAGAEIEVLARRLRHVVAGGPLDDASGRTLEVPIGPVPILVAGRGDAVLAAAGRVADRALLWAVPEPDLDRSAGIVLDAAAGRPAGERPALVWAPLVDFGGSVTEHLGKLAAYSVLNSRRELHERWGLDPGSVEVLRRRLVAEGASAAVDLLPATAVEDVVVSDPRPDVVAERALRLGVSSIAVPASNLRRVGADVAWARAVVDRLGAVLEGASA